MNQKTEKASSHRQVRDAEATKQKILDVAEKEFARYGLSGARTGAIAKLAKVSSRMLYYYFESKEGLYKAVLERPAGEIHELVQQLQLDRLPPRSALEALIKAAINYEMTYRQRGMLLFQEANQNQGKYFKVTNWQAGIELVTKLLERGMKMGVFRELDPYMTTMTILGVCLFYSNSYENFKHLTPDRDLLSPENVDRYTKASIQLILEGVLKT